jgi:hypothetical protein
MSIAIQLSLIHVHSILSHRMSAASDVQPCFIKLSIFTILVPGSFPCGLPAFVFLYTLDQTSIIKVLMTGHRITQNHRIYNCLVRKVIGCWLHVYPAFKTSLYNHARHRFKTMALVQASWFHTNYFWLLHIYYIS